MSKHALLELQTVNHGSIGIDVHKDKLVACCVEVSALDCGAEKINKTFFETRGTQQERDKLVQWCLQKHPEVVLMESTGIYWKAIYRDLEKVGLNPEIINPRHFHRTDEGRKTDKGDALWLAGLARLGIYRQSFIPPEPYRNLRLIVTEHRNTVDEIARSKNRLLKILDDCGYRFSVAFSNIDGVSAQKILQGILNDEPKEKLLTYIHARCKKPKKDIIEAVQGELNEHARAMIKLLLQKIEFLDTLVEKLEQQLRIGLKNNQKEIELLQTLPGIDEMSAMVIISFITGTPSNYFANSHMISRWLGVCPGNNESAGKSKSGKVPKGLKVFKRIFIECSNAASRTKGTLFARFYTRLRYSKGHCKACTAVAHKLMKLVYWVLKFRKPYLDMFADYTSELSKRKRARWISALIWYGFVPYEQIKKVRKSEITMEMALMPARS